MNNFTDVPPNKLGAWSPPTSAVNFCEIDYEITIYIAEFINTLSNFAYIYYAVAYLRPSAAVSIWNPLTWPFTNSSLFIVGLGSSLFHATLKHEAQMIDEMGMYAIITALNYAVWSYRTFTSTFQRLVLGGVLFASTATVAYKNITSTTGASTNLHLAIFVLLITTFWPRVRHLIAKERSEAIERARVKFSTAAHRDKSDVDASNASSSSRQSDSKSSLRDRTSNANNHASAAQELETQFKAAEAEAKKVRKARFFRYNLGAYSFLVGFAFWLVDGLACDQLRAIRASVGLPLAWVLEFHGFWHFLTALGAGAFVGLVMDLTDESGSVEADLR